MNPSAIVVASSIAARLKLFVDWFAPADDRYAARSSKPTQYQPASLMKAAPASARPNRPIAHRRGEGGEGRGFPACRHGGRATRNGHRGAIALGERTDGSADQIGNRLGLRDRNRMRGIDVQANRAGALGHEPES